MFRAIIPREEVFFEVLILILLLLGSIMTNEQVATQGGP